MPIRGRGRRLIDKFCWGLILKHVAHRQVIDVWDTQAGEASWDAAGRNGGLGAENVDLRNYDDLRTAIALAKQIEESFSARMGRTSSEREMEHVYFEEAMEEVVREEFGKPDAQGDGAVLQGSPESLSQTVNERLHRP